MNSASKVVDVKKEPSDNRDIENSIILWLATHPSGLKLTQLNTEFPDIDPTDLVATVNKITKKKIINLVTKANGELYYVLANQEAKNKSAKTAADAGKSEGHDEKLVYQIIEEVGNQGIWNKIIQDKSRIQTKQLDKILKNLETKKLIKRVTSVLAAKKKIYMVSHLEPDRSLTGGTWYSDQDFDSAFVDLMNTFCLSILVKKVESLATTGLDPLAQRNASFLSSSEILNIVQASNVSKVVLTVSDIESILQTLMFDGKVEKTVVINNSGEHVNMYCAVSSLIATTGLMRMPCGLCPVINECHVGGTISPANCEYMNNWLQF